MKASYSKLLFTLLAGFLLLNCEKDCDDRTKFLYNERTGRCENCEGEIGFNILVIDEIRKSKIAECLDLNGHDLVYLLDTVGIENFNESGYNTLKGYNFRGSKFDGASIFFNNIYNADFSGADLRNIGYGYAVITGEMDQYTLLPLSGNCKIEGDSLICGH